MEGDEGVITSIPSSPPSDSDSPLGLPEDSLPEEEVPPSDEDRTSQPIEGQTSQSVLTDELRDQIINQVEYYFSDENISTDKFLRKHVKKDKDGFVSIAAIAVHKMKNLVQDSTLIAAALRKSSVLVVSSDGKKVRRLHPLPVPEVRDSKLCTVFVENLPEDQSTDNIHRIFCQAGNIKNISIRDPHAVEESAKGNKSKQLLGGKVHALVEYETPEAAEKAAATLNDERDWRNGMRVQLLRKRMVMGSRRKGQQRSDTQKNSKSQSSDLAGAKNHNSNENENVPPERDDEDHSPVEKNARKGRNRGRTRGQKYRGNNGHGHGTTVSSLGGGEVSKPPPGPRMPDGTRGFTMGRGRPPRLQ